MGAGADGWRCAAVQGAAGRFAKCGSAAGTVAPSHLLHRFDKLTIKFELLCKKLKVSSFKTSAGRQAGAGGVKTSRCGGVGETVGGG